MVSRLGSPATSNVPLIDSTPRRAAAGQPISPVERAREREEAGERENCVEERVLLC